LVRIDAASPNEAAWIACSSGMLLSVHRLQTSSTVKDKPDTAIERGDVGVQSTAGAQLVYVATCFASGEPGPIWIQPGDFRVTDRPGGPRPNGLRVTLPGQRRPCWIATISAAINYVERVAS